MDKEPVNETAKRETKTSSNGFIPKQGLTKLLDRLKTTKTQFVNPPSAMEFNDKSTEKDIYYCFRLLLGRNPSEVEWKGHKSLAGNDLKDVVSNYLTSPEFKSRKLGTLSNTEHVLVDLKDYKMYVSLSDTAVGLTIYRTKSYEPHVTKAITEKLKSGMVFVDIGANIGYFSLLAANLIGPDGKVLAFEPYQYNVKLLYLNARINGFENIEINPCALADKRSLFAYDNMASNGVISELNADLDTLLSTTLVSSVTIDEVLQNANRMDIIKIDVEGAEYLALSGGNKLLKRHRPIIYSEFAPPSLQVVSKVSAETYLRLLLVDDNYNISVLDTSGDFIDCKRDINKVIKCFEDAASDHIDLVAYPIDKQ